MYVIASLVPMMLIVAISSSIYDGNRSGWTQLAIHHTNSQPVQYQADTYRLRLIRQALEYEDHIFHIKLMLDDSGFFFSKPEKHYGGINKGHRDKKRPPAFSPLHIPWDAITQCTQTETKLITMPVKDTDVSLQLALWAFLSPLCEEKNIPTIYEKQKDTAVQ